MEPTELSWRVSTVLRLRGSMAGEDGGGGRIRTNTWKHSDASSTSDESFARPAAPRINEAGSDEKYR